MYLAPVVVVRASQPENILDERIYIRISGLSASKDCQQREAASGPVSGVP